MKRYILAFTAALIAPIAFAQQDINWNVTLQTTNSGGDFTPLWLSANKYGLSSVDKYNIRSEAVEHFISENSVFPVFFIF